eukprot:scaffold13758_cov120-Isochrysis_galbana.AAC.5
MDVPRNLRRLASHEKTFVANFFACEAKRVAYSQARAELRKEAAGADETRRAVADTTRMQDEEDEEEREAAEKASLEIEFQALENKFLQQMGLRSPPPEEPAASPGLRRWSHHATERRSPQGAARGLWILDLELSWGLRAVCTCASAHHRALFIQVARDVTGGWLVAQQSIPGSLSLPAVAPALAVAAGSRSRAVARSRPVPRGRVWATVHSAQHRAQL